MRNSLWLGTVALATVPFIYLQAQPKPAAFVVPRGLPPIYWPKENPYTPAKAELGHFTRGEVDKAGSAIHEHGTCRMGGDPRRSALNSFCQMHDVKNVFVVDGAAFTTASEKNPTLTILALTWRATDYMAAEMQRGNI